MKGMPPTKRTPQNKKALSYAKDRRNCYSASDKAARKAIPARKAGESRKSRRKAAQSLNVVERVDEVVADLIDSSLLHDVERVGGWRKGADETLRDHIDRQQARAGRREGRKGRVQAERERQVADPKFTGLIMIDPSIHDPELR